MRLEMLVVRGRTVQVQVACWLGWGEEARNGRARIVSVIRGKWNGKQNVEDSVGDSAASRQGNVVFGKCSEAKPEREIVRGLSDGPFPSLSARLSRTKNVILVRQPKNLPWQPGLLPLLKMSHLHPNRDLERPASKSRGSGCPCALHG